MDLSYLQAIPSALIAVDRALTVRFINPAAEDLLGVSVSPVLHKDLSNLPGCEGEVKDLCARVFASGEAISLFEYTLRIPLNHRVVTLHATPVLREGAINGPIPSDELLITIEKSDGISRVAASEWKQEMTRAAGVMAAMLAHEVKNPLSGIRGAAQLLKEDVPPEQQGLADLICMETDRIRDLLAQVEIFADAPAEKQSINIHEVLQYVISIAHTGFAPHVTFKERYDPSLPPVLGHRDLLVQLFLNLVKNSAEALADHEQAVITLSTHYRSGYKIRLGQSEERMALPVAVTIEDNGPGIPEAIRVRLFEPFVSSKEQGRGLGLAVVAKIASDLGVFVELDKEYDKGARFIVMLACA